MGLIVHNVTRPFFPDTTSPTTPVLDVPSVAGNSVTLSWSAATDLESGVVGYVVIIDGNPQPNIVKALSVVISGLQQGSHSFQVIARDGSGNFSQPSNTRTVQIGAIIIVTSGRKFHPGHYMGSNNINGFTAENGATGGNGRNNNEMNILAASGPNVLGIYDIYTLDVLEAADGVYNFAGILNDFNYLKLHCPGKRFGIMIWCEAFSGTGATGLGVPPYILNNSIYGPGLDGTHFGWWGLDFGKGQHGRTAAIWRALVMERYIRVFEHLAATPTGDGFTFDTHPLIELITDQESSLTLSAGSDYTDATFLAQNKLKNSRVKAAFPHTTFAASMNFVRGAPSLMAPYVQDAANKGCGFSCPDVQGVGLTWAQDVLVGNVYNGTAWVPGGTDLRSVMPVIPFVESPDFNTGNNTPAKIMASTQALKANQVWWVVLTGGIADWKTVILPLINANPIQFTACPTAYQGECFGG